MNKYHPCLPRARDTHPISIHMLVWNDFINDARVLKEAQTLQAAGYQVVVHAAQAQVQGKTTQYEILSGGVEVHRYARWKAGVLKPIKWLYRLWWHLSVLTRLCRMRVDVIHAHDADTLPTAWLAAKIMDVPLVYDAHEISTNREGVGGIPRFLVACVESRLLPKATAVITTTELRARFFARAYHVKRPLVLQNRARQLHPTFKKTSRIRQELGLNNPWPIILYQGGLQAGRGLEGLLQAATQIPSAYFVFIGNGRLFLTLKNICINSELQERVFFIPMVSLNELPSYTASADIGVQPIKNTCLNHWTTDSNKLFEYVQAGLPVVTSDLPEIRKIMHEHDFGILVEQGNTDALVTALRQLVDDAKRRLYYAHNAAKAAHILSWEKQESKFLDLYREIV